MASITYKDSSVFLKTDEALFDTVYHPGNKPNYSGMYQCVGCKHIIVHTGGETLPSQNHAQHNTTKHGAIRWKLIAGHTA